MATSSKKLIVITGASAGIGAATATYFSQKGHPLLLLARRQEKMQELNLPNSLCLKCDVTNIQEVEKCIAEGIKKYGPVDCLINNAGAMYWHLDVANQEIDEWNKMIELNCKGLLNGIKTTLPEMKKNQQGTIINIGSLAGKRTAPGASVYVGTKFFVHAVTENMREEMAQFNVRLITIAPGAVESELRDHMTDPNVKEKLKNLFKLFDPLEAVRVAESIWFAYNMPQDCCVREIVLAPTKQPK